MSYVGIRADEPRDGYVSTKPTITSLFPFKERGLVRKDIEKIVEESGIGFPRYYQWRSRSGCYFCFFQAKYEWIHLKNNHPAIFQDAVNYETLHSDGRRFTWNEGETLQELAAREDTIMKDHALYMEKQGRNSPNKTLAEALADVLNDEEAGLPCLKG